MKDITIAQFVRDRDGQPRGLVVATVIDESVRLGWSYTNTKAGDRFDKARAYNIALGRAEKGWGEDTRMPHRVEKVYNKVIDRAQKYFKDTPLCA